MRGESATWDETHYLGLGKYLLQTGRWDVPGSILHPPLSYYLHSLPLLFIDTDPAVWKPDPTRAASHDYLAAADIARGQAILSSPANASDRLLTSSRLMMVATAVLLGCFVFAWSEALYGPRSAVLAAVLFSFCPNILAHAHLITPDITLTTFAFIGVYYWWRLLRTPRIRHALLGGVGLGLTLLSKFSGMLLIPICLLLLALSGIQRRTIPWRGCILSAATGVAVLLLGYGLDLHPYFAGIEFQRRHVADGHPSFLMGGYSTSGWWYYFLVAFAIKTPVAMLILLAIELTAFVQRIRRAGWVDEAFLLVPVLAILGFFSVDHHSIGLRYILPIYPFLFVFVSHAASTMIAGGARTRMLGAALVIWYVGASIWIHPHSLAYFNELVGGPSHGYRYLVDSNLDWGQDLKGLKRYMDERGIPRVSLSYFGSDTPERYGIPYDWLPSPVLRDPSPGQHETAPPGWVAVSATNLQGVYFVDKDIYASFRNRTPDAVIGYSIFVYRVHSGERPSGGSTSQP